MNKEIWLEVYPAKFSIPVNVKESYDSAVSQTVNRTVKKARLVANLLFLDQHKKPFNWTHT